jgi:hypothetical protein
MSIPVSNTYVERDFLTLLKVLEFMLKLATYTFVRLYMIIYSYVAFQIIFHTTINFSCVYLHMRLMYFLKIAST